MSEDSIIRLYILDSDRFKNASAFLSQENYMKKNLFIIMFCLAIVLPNIVYYVFQDHFDTENYENRAYAEMPAFTFENIEEIPEGLENYYMDRVPFKNEIKSVTSKVDVELGKYRSLYEILNGGLSGVTLGIDGWMYYTVNGESENSINEMFGRNMYSDDELASISSMIKDTSDFFRNSGAEFIPYVVPNKEQVYDQYLPETYQRHITNYTRANQLADYVNEHTDVKMIYPLDYMKKYRDSINLFYKYDTHWNQPGAFVGIQPILETVGIEAEEVTDQKFEKITPCYSNDLAKILNLQDSYTDDVDLVLVDYKPEIEVHAKDEEYSVPDNIVISVRYDSNAPDDREVVFIGDSFRNMLVGMQILPKYFSHVSIVSRYQEKQLKDYFNKYNPDIVIYEMSERYVKDPETVYTGLVDLIRQ